MLDVLTSKLSVLILTWLVLAVSVATGYLYEIENVILAFGAWTGGVVSTLIVQEIQRLRSFR